MLKAGKKIKHIYFNGYNKFRQIYSWRSTAIYEQRVHVHCSYKVIVSSLAIANIDKSEENGKWLILLLNSTRVHVTKRIF